MKNLTAYLPMTRGQHILGMEGKEVHPVMRPGGKNALGQEIKTLLMMFNTYQVVPRDTQNVDAIT